MNYEKNSFLAGIAVGRQLKGWGTTGAAPILPPPSGDGIGTLFGFSGGTFIPFTPPIYDTEVHYT